MGREEANGVDGGPSVDGSFLPEVSLSAVSPEQRLHPGLSLRQKKTGVPRSHGPRTRPLSSGPQKTSIGKTRSVDRSCHGDTPGLSGTHGGVRRDLLEKRYFTSKPTGSRGSGERERSSARRGTDAAGGGEGPSVRSRWSTGTPGHLRPGRAGTLWSGGRRAVGRHRPGHLGMERSCRGAQAGARGAAEPGVGRGQGCQDLDPKGGRLAGETRVAATPALGGGHTNSGGRG